MKLEDVARLAGVSRTTASYVINGKAEQHRISPQTCERVMAVVREHNYRPDQAAAALRLGSTRLIGFILPDLENQSYARLAKLLEARAREQGFQLIITCSDDDPATEMALADILVARRIDALLVSSVLEAQHPFYANMQARGTPVIALDRALDPALFASVISEDLQGAQQLTASLLTPAPASIGLLGAVAEMAVSRQREQGFRAALAAMAPQLQPDCRYGAHFSRDVGASVCQQWLDEGTLPEALVTTSYVLLEGVLDVLAAHPQKLAAMRLATFGDNRLLDFLPVRVNALPQQFPLIAERALQLTLAATHQDYRPGIQVIPRLLKVRS